MMRYHQVTYNPVSMRTITNDARLKPELVDVSTAE